MVGLIRKIFQKAFKSSWIFIDFVEKWQYSDLPKYSKNGVLSLFDLLILFAYNFFSLKASKTQLVSTERSFNKLSEAHEFQLNWLKNGDTVLSQSTVKKWNLSLFDLSTLFAHNFLSLKASKSRLVLVERSFNKWHGVTILMRTGGHRQPTPLHTQRPTQPHSRHRQLRSNKGSRTNYLYISLFF